MEHIDDVKTTEDTKYTRSARRESETQYHKSALADHTSQQNHIIDWDESKILTREGHKHTRWIRESIHIRKEGPKGLNRDQGQYPLPHLYDPLLVNPAYKAGVKQ